MLKNGKLYLVPTPLGENGLHTLPRAVFDLVHEIEFIVAEKAKTARHFIKATGTARPMHAYQVTELDERATRPELEEMLRPIFEGKDVGVMSEAGCPGIADPGARLVALAHEKGVRVVPLAGPSSILLALMASGLNGQNFRFLGYLPAKVDKLAEVLKKLEMRANSESQTQVFIETPYRNGQVVEQALKALSPDTLFCIAADLTLETEFVATKKISDWRGYNGLDLHKRPAVFLIGGRW